MATAKQSGKAKATNRKPNVRHGASAATKAVLMTSLPGAGAMTRKFVTKPLMKAASAMQNRNLERSEARKRAETAAKDAEREAYRKKMQKSGKK